MKNVRTVGLVLAAVAVGVALGCGSLIESPATLALTTRGTAELASTCPPPPTPGAPADARQVPTGPPAPDAQEFSGVVELTTASGLVVAGRFVEVNSATEIRKGRDEISLAQVVIGELALVKGSFEGSRFVASSITLSVLPNGGSRAPGDHSEDCQVMEE